MEIAVVSASGEWLATVDLRNNDEEFSEEVYLKIWRWESKRWILNTRIDRPHGWKTIVALSFRPVHGEQGDLFMTAGSDGLLKTWSTRFISNKDERSEGMKTTLLKSLLQLIFCSFLDLSIKLLVS